MAITKIHSIKHTVGKAIDYICDSNKTNGEQLIYSYNCTRETAALEFELTAQNARNGGQNKAYHLIQSFRPGEVTEEQAHMIAKQWADEVLQGKYEYVLATHTDKEHIHSHIIFNAVSFKDFKRYKSDKKSYYRLCEISDNLCKKYGIELVKKGTHKQNFSYEKKHPKYISKKSLIKNAIDEAILYSMTYEDFLDEMRKRNYILKQDKYLWFRSEKDKRFTKTDTIGFAYKAENIQKRIKGLYRPKDMPFLILIENNIKVNQSKAYENWAKIYNLKVVAHSLLLFQQAGFSSFDELSDKITEHAKEIQKLQSQNNDARKRISEIDKITKNIQTLKKYKPVIEEYNKKTLLKKSFYDKHKSEIESYKNAQKFLREHLVDGKYPNIKKLETEKERLIEKITANSSQAVGIKSKHDELAVLKYNIDTFLGGTNSKIEQNQEKQHTSLIDKIKDNQKRISENKHNRQSPHNKKGHNNYEL